MSSDDHSQEGTAELCFAVPFSPRIQPVGSGGHFIIDVALWETWGGYSGFNLAVIAK